MAAALAESMRLGQHDTTDVLAVSFSSPDLVGHAFGPRSHEVQDLYAHLDRTIGLLLDRLDALVGAEHYVVALSADHGVADIPEQTQRSRHEGGRIDSRVMADLLERRARAALGPGQYVARVNGNDVYFQRETYERLTRMPAAMAAIVKVAADYPGIARVFRKEELQSGAESHDSLLRAAALSYVPRRSGDLILAARPGWIFNSSGTGTTHGSANPDDQRVPLLFFGQGIKPGLYTALATPADLAPTLAALCGIELPRAEGHALRMALATQRAGDARK
jgi:predicted AlkP superfamily pyrophosphatase or phosphodiesterase